MQLTEIGKYAEECVRKIETHYDDVEIPLYVIMPNHIHMIICIDGNSGNGNGKRTRKNGNGCEHVETEHARLYHNGRHHNGRHHNGRHHQKHKQKMRTISRSKGRLSSVVGSIKSAVTRYANENDILLMANTLS